MKNQMRTPNQFVQIRLVDETRNRDAIGARVEIHLDDGRTLVQSVRAGGGFLSQSSKWVHFGLGEDSHIKQVVVRWPDGFRESLVGIQPNGRYSITRNADVSASVVHQTPRGERDIRLDASIPHANTPVEAARIVLTQRRPVPELAYQAIDGNIVTLATRSGHPLLINLWTSTCANCMAELSELSEHIEGLRNQHLTIIAMCADELTSSADEHDSPILASRRERFGFPFTVGGATAETVKRLTMIHGDALYDEQLPLPTSFLIDQQGRLAVIYKGRVTAAQLLSDLTLIDRTDVTLADVLPFPGRHGLPAFDISAVGMATAYEEGGYVEDAEQELVRYIVKSREAIAEAKQLSAKSRDQLARTYHYLATMLSRHGRRQEALAVAQQATQLFPKNTELQSLAAQLRLASP
jgi:peroxiredoxin